MEPDLEPMWNRRRPAEARIGRLVVEARGGGFRVPAPEPRDLPRVAEVLAVEEAVRRELIRRRLQRTSERRAQSRPFFDDGTAEWLAAHIARDVKL